MAYDEDLANRIRELLGAERGVEEKRMFGGLAFLINGNMSVAASGQGGLLVRVPPDDTDRLLAYPTPRVTQPCSRRLVRRPSACTRNQPRASRPAITIGLT